jgi:cobalamin biosynthesis protein CobD/CbiB
MASMAGALGVTLSKPGHYSLGGGRSPDPAAITQACRVAASAVALSVALALGGLWALR